MAFDVDTDKLSDVLQYFYLDYLNNFLTIEKFADHHGIHKNVAAFIVIEGKAIHQERTNG